MLKRFYFLSSKKDLPYSIFCDTLVYRALTEVISWQKFLKLFLMASMARLFSGGVRAKSAITQHMKNVKKILELTQDIEAVASQMQHGRGEIVRKLTRGDGDFLLNYLKKAMLSIKKLQGSQVGGAVFRWKVVKNQFKEGSPKFHIELKKEESSLKKKDDRLNLNTNQKKERGGELSEKKLNIGFIGKVKAKISNRKLSKDYAKRLKKEKGKIKKLQARNKTPAMHGK